MPTSVSAAKPDRPAGAPRRPAGIGAATDWRPTRSTGADRAFANEDEGLAAQPLSTDAEAAAGGAVPSRRARLSICAGVNSAPCVRMLPVVSASRTASGDRRQWPRDLPRAEPLIRGTWHSVRRRATRRFGSFPAVSEPTPPEHPHREEAATGSSSAWACSLACRFWRISTQTEFRPIRYIRSSTRSRFRLQPSTVHLLD